MRKFQNQTEYIEAVISEKITLAHVEAATRLYSFSNPSSNVYTTVTPYVVVDVTNYTQRSDSSVTDGEWYYDIPSKTLYIGENDPIDQSKVIVKYRLFFSDAPVITSFDLQDVGSMVEYEARIKKAPNFKSSLGVNQKGSSFADSGTLELENTDGYFDSIYDTLVYENKQVSIYSWNRQLEPSEAKLVFRGNIYDKSFTDQSVSFQIKNAFTRIEEAINLSQYTTSDNVSSQFLDNYKRSIYGKVNQALVRSIDQVADGFELTGTVSVDITANATVTGTGTDFITELDDGDTIEVDSFEYTVASTLSGSSMTISSNNPIYGRAQNSSFEKITLSGLTGTVDSNILTPKIITGNGTIFLTELSSGDDIKIAGFRYKIDTVDSDTQLTLESNIQNEFQNTNPQKYTTSSLSGSISFNPPGRLVNGTGTIFLDECTQDDKITLEGQEYVVEEVLDDTTLLIDGDNFITGNISGSKATLVPEIPYRKKNRTFLVTGHALKEFSTTIVEQKDLNRVLVSDSTGMEPGDIISIYNGSTLVQRAELLRTVGNQLTFTANLQEKYPAGYIVQKDPITAVYVDGSQISIDDILTIDNTSTACKFTIDIDTEFNITPTRNIPYSFQFINGSRTVTLATAGVDILEKINPRDFIKSVNDTELDFADVLRVEETTITLRSPYTGESRITTMHIRRPNYVSDDSSVTVDCNGKTDDNLPTGNLITSGPLVVKDLLTDAGLSQLMNTTSFDEAANNSTYTIGISIPEDITSTTLPTIKDIADKIGRTVSGSLSINSDLEISYTILDITTPITKDLPTLRFDDLKSWKVKSKSGNIYSEVNANFNFRDYDNVSKEADKDVVIIQNEFAQDFDTSNKTDNININVADSAEAQELAERYVFYNSLSQAEITLTSDLRLSTYSMGDKVILDIPRLYTRLGETSSTLKVCTIVGMDTNAQGVTMRLNDLGNLYNRGSVITSDDEVDYSVSTIEQRLYASYMTNDDNGSINNDDESFNTNLIF